MPFRERIGFGADSFGSESVSGRISGAALICGAETEEEKENG